MLKRGPLPYGASRGTTLSPNSQSCSRWYIHYKDHVLIPLDHVVVVSMWFLEQLGNLSIWSPIKGPQVRLTMSIHAYKITCVHLLSISIVSSPSHLQPHWVDTSICLCFHCALNLSFIVQLHWFSISIVLCNSIASSTSQPCVKNSIVSLPLVATCLSWIKRCSISWLPFL